MSEIILTNRYEITPGAWQPESLFDRWLGYLDQSERTRAEYTRNVKRFLAWLLEEGVSAPDRGDIIRYRDHLASRHAPATVNAYLAALRCFFGWLDYEGLYRDCTRGVRSLKLAPGFKRDCLSREELQAVLSGIDTSTPVGLRDWTMISFMACTGLRESELAGALVGDLDRAYGTTVLWVKGKGRPAKDQCVKVPFEALQRLRVYLDSRGNPGPEAPLFASCNHATRGEAMPGDTISRLVKRRFKAAGLDSARLTCHSLRHTAGTEMRRAGLPIEEVAVVLRHASTATTRYYDHTLERERINGEEVLAGRLL